MWTRLFLLSILFITTSQALALDEVSLEANQPIVIRYIPPQSEASVFQKKGLLFQIKDLNTKKTYSLKLLKKSPQSAALETLWKSPNKKVSKFSISWGQQTLFMNISKEDSQSVIEVYKTQDEALLAQTFDENFKKITSFKLKIPSTSLRRNQTGPETNLRNANILQDFLAASSLSAKAFKGELETWIKKEVTQRNLWINQTKKSTASQKAKNESLAKESTKKAFLETQNKNHQDASALFLKAYRSAPYSPLIYQNYGLSLFRNKEYVHSLAVLLVIENETKKKSANQYFQALNYFQLNDLQNAEVIFLKIINSTAQKSLKVKSHYYLGLIYQQLNQYDKAQKSFQYVLDNSNDPKLDAKAEAMIESGIKKKAFNKKNSKRLFYSGLLGLIYDSNIVLAIDGQANQQTDQEGLRLMNSNQLEYKYFRGEKNELSLALEATLLQSQKTDLSSSSSLQSADPWLFAIEAPWSHRGRLFGKSHSFSLIPRYETIHMDLDDTVRKDIIHSAVVNLNNQWIMSSDWIFSADLQLRSDDANSGTGTITDEADATQVSLNTSAVIVLNKDKEKYLIPLLRYTSNDAKGDDFAYNRIDIALTYTSALFGSLAWNTRLGYYQADYKSVRVDDNWSLGSGMSYDWTKETQIGLNLSYQDNQSNTNQYDKFQALSTLRFNF